MAKTDSNNACGLVTEHACDVLARHGGGISIKHGMGLLKKPCFRLIRLEVEIALMRQPKRVFDPHG
ncbi:FAD-linked oxidase C-terminal domain-containing protein, partial [Dyella sp.]|uniref:FAD-linked oxidase C-terminal domain-containing protein n=1 Tax=Dyella sp. TaxID=1869338 RepID=UPI002D799818